MQNPVGLAVADRAQHDGLRLQRPRHPILSEVVKRVIVYTTEHCSLCVSAKALLDRRGIGYQEINLTRDPDGRVALQQRTGMFTFPQIVVDDQPIGGFRELLAADREGRLTDLLAA